MRKESAKAHAEWFVDADWLSKRDAAELASMIDIENKQEKDSKKKRGTYMDIEYGDGFLAFNDTEFYVSGKWSGTIKITTPLTNNDLDWFGVDEDKWDDMKRLTSIDNPEKPVLMSDLREGHYYYSQDEDIYENLRQGSFMGDIMSYTDTDGELHHIGWAADFDCEINGKKVKFRDLPKSVYMNIAEKAMYGSTEGEIDEYVSKAYDVSLESTERVIENGILTNTVRGNVLIYDYEPNEQHFVNAEYNADTDNFSIIQDEKSFDPIIQAFLDDMNFGEIKDVLVLEMKKALSSPEKEFSADKNTVTEESEKKKRKNRGR